MKKFIKKAIIPTCITIGVVLISRNEIFWGCALLWSCLFFIIKHLWLIQNLVDESLCYRIRLSIMPKWKAILPKLEPTIDHLNLDWDKIFDDPELEINKEYSLYGKDFVFVLYQDEFSGLNQIWLQNFKTFLDDLEIKAKIFYDCDFMKLSKKYGITNEIIEKIKNFSVSPWWVGYPEYNWPGENKEAVRLSIIPYNEIIYHLKCLKKKARSRGMNGILEFPEKLQKLFDEYMVTYDKKHVMGVEWGYDSEWRGIPLPKEYTKNIEEAGFRLSKDRMENHVFSTKHFSIAINIKYFNRQDLVESPYDE